MTSELPGGPGISPENMAFIEEMGAVGAEGAGNNVVPLFSSDTSGNEAYVNKAYEVFKVALEGTTHYQDPATGEWLPKSGESDASDAPATDDEHSGATILPFPVRRGT